MRHFLLLLLAFISYFSVARADLPENDLWKEDGLFFSSMTEAEFNKIIDDAYEIYAPVVASHGARLTIRKLWNDPTVNANASKMGTSWLVQMYGGLARRPEVTPDGFAQVVCHELFHLLGGFPFYTGQQMSTEGQADYGATQACSKKLWAKSENGSSRYEIPAFVKKSCDEVYKQPAEQELCYRTAAAGQSLANLLARLQGAPEPSYENPDTSVVSRTYEAHPGASCRLTTYLAGALCSIPFNSSVIPGTQAEAFKYSCASGKAARPTCWFKAQ
jgi:hypothetical protein